jgi:hypothetical protein
MTGYQLSPRVTLQPGDRFRVAGGPYYRLASGERVPMAARGTFVLLTVERTARGRVTLLAYGTGGYAVLHVAGRRRSRVPGLVARPYRVRRVGAKSRRKDCGLDTRSVDA